MEAFFLFIAKIIGFFLKLIWFIIKLSFFAIVIFLCLLNFSQMPFFKDLRRKIKLMQVGWKLSRFPIVKDILGLD